MAKLTRHVGRIKSSGVRCAVVFRKLEDDPKSCLIVETDTLPDMLHDNIMTIINGAIAQKEVDLYKGLTRSTLSDGSNALNALHERKYLRKIEIDKVEMVPFPNRAVPLADINASIDQTGDVVPTEAPVAPVETAEAPVEATEESAQVAANLLAQADLMEQDAQAKRAEAYRLNPDLDPSNKVEAKPKAKAKEKVDTKKKDKRVKSEAEKKATQEARNERRRQRYAEQKQAELDAKLEKQIAEKIVRDAERAEAE